MTTDHIPLSQSLLWQKQTTFYEKSGIAAWQPGKVPYHITNNPILATRYATIIVAFIKDYFEKFNPDERIASLLELGGGCGKFAYLLIQELTTQCNHDPTLRDIKLHYTLCDCSAQTIAFWKAHPKLRPLLEDQKLYYQNATSENIHKIYERDPLMQGHHPHIVIANYVFDSLSADAFHCHHGNLFSASLTSSLDTSHAHNPCFTYQPCTLPYYHNMALDTLLAHYTQQLQDCRLLIPIGAITCLQNIQKARTHPSLVLSADKGFLSPDALDYDEQFNLINDGSIATMVNFHAISEILKTYHGDSYLQASPSDTLKLCPLLINAAFPSYPHTLSAMQQQLQQEGIHSIFSNIKSLDHSPNSFETLINILTDSHHDPYTYSSLNQYIIHLIPTLSSDQKQLLIEGLNHACTLLYFMPDESDDIILISQIYHKLDQHDPALSLLHEYLPLYGETFWFCFEIGHHYFAINQYPQAAIFLEKALNKNPKSRTGKQLLAHCQFNLRKAHNEP